MEDYTIGERIMILRQKNNLTQEELALSLSIKRSKIADWEKGRGTPNTEDVIKLSKALDTSCDTILIGTDTKYLSRSKKTGLTELAIKRLEQLQSPVYNDKPGCITAGRLMSYLLESERMDEFLVALINLNTALRRSKKRFVITNLINDKEKNHKNYQNYEKFMKWADENGFIAVPPKYAINYYLQMMAGVFVSVVEERLKESLLTKKEGLEQTLERFTRIYENDEKEEV